ncbi:hypothetical protein JW859_03205 [bacterium]|nr:hypothetical protein [bacterium]
MRIGGQSGWILAILCAWVPAGCGTHNIGGSTAPDTTMSASVSVSGELRGGETVVWDVAITGGTPPYTVNLDTGGGTWEDPPRDVQVDAGYNGEFTMINLGVNQSLQYDYSATISDAEGQYVITGGSYSVLPLIPVLEIDELYNGSPGATYQLIMLSVRANDPSTDELSVSVATTAGIETIEAEELAAAAGNVTDLGSTDDAYPGQVRTWDFSIPVWSTDVIDGSRGVATVTVRDSWGQEATEELQLELPGRYELPFHSLAAIPLETSVDVDEEVTVVVACGEFPENQPFHYIGNIGLTAEVGANAVGFEPNPGAPGDPADSKVDGIWLKQDPPPSGFSTGFSEPLILKSEIGDGRARFDLGVFPVGGNSTTEGGCLLNVDLWFAEPGTYTLGFEEFNEVNRTYYSDQKFYGGNEYLWADISNDYAGVPNSITVRE